MFSPEASIQSARSSLRTKRRPRASEELQQPRRKRSKLSAETFVAREDAHTNGNGSALTNGHVSHGGAEKSLALMEMPVREKKGPLKRATKEDHGLYLVRQWQSSQVLYALTTDIVQTKNANYSVKKLRGFPSALLRPSSTSQCRQCH
jgi:nuclear pore complex protein Nup133